MCELIALSCRYPARLTTSLTGLAARAQKAVSRNHDGWGAAFYQGADIALYRDTSAADQSPLVPWLEAHGPEATLSMAYIRHATQGSIELANTGPYVRELNGRMRLFAHNGNLTGIRSQYESDRRRYHPVGDTDSEAAFCLLLETLAAQEGDYKTLPPVDERLANLAVLFGELRELGPANFLYADSQTLFVYADRRFQPATGKIEAPALYLLSCGSEQSPELLDQNVASSFAPGQHVALISTVPLNDKPWRPLAEGELLAIEAGRIVARTCLPTRKKN
ncbi:class II glutamine amidotransferase [Vreelandella boliviensis]|uniref:Class II glutamine amidotransferase n=2 Tax=Vreelandella boliviensis TaxID=223527 RepID=A0A265DUM7_9GAMM|nr:class II glutamine amidotransferase [Halomonas boliviensis]EHJ92266.1 Putative glutamine amidotransferase yafJ [Halomonas boliviensis LC1]OZT73019.1 class II glutamine amidotransferase [Halomonas boliviensis LC1]